MRLRIRLLGRFAVEVDGVQVPDEAWGSRRSRQLVAILALTAGRRLTVEQVMDALWPDLDPDAARANRHKAASLARRAIRSKEAVVFRGGAVLLGPTLEVSVDLDELEAAAAAALGSGPAACAEAAAGYPGDLPRGALRGLGGRTA